MVMIGNVALSYPDRIFSLENFQILVPVEIWKFFKFFRYPINHTDNMKPMAGPVLNFAIDFSYKKKFGFQDTRSNRLSNAQLGGL